jgi:hypothetical protein
MTATPFFVYRSLTIRDLGKRLVPRRLTLRTRSTPGRLRHVRLGAAARRQERWLPPREVEST